MSTSTSTAPMTIAVSSPAPPSIVPLHVRVASASIGSLMTALIVSPIDVVKVRIQANQTIPLSGSSPMSITSKLCTTTKAASTAARKLVQCNTCGTVLMHNGLQDYLLPTNLHPAPASAANSAANAAKSQSIYQSGGIFRIMRHIFTVEGVGGLYAGLSPTLLMSVPNTVLYFTAYDNLRLTLPNTSPLVTGSLARLLSSTVVAPFELIRVRTMNLNAGEGGGVKRTSILQEANKLIAAGGVRNLWSGLAASLWRDVPFSGIYWYAAESCRGGMYESIPQPHSNATTFMVEFAAGAASGTIAACFTTPFDVVKTRLQVETAIQMNTVKETGSSGVHVHGEKCDHAGLQTVIRRGVHTHSDRHVRAPPSSTFVHLQTIYKEEGVGALWRGNVARCLRVAPACAIMLSCYEVGKRLGGEALEI